MDRPSLDRPKRIDVVGGLLLLVLAAGLVGVAVVIAAG
jgi:hypothetical protein